MAITFLPVIDPEGIQQVADIADEVWHEHYASILKKEQIDYMVQKFQSVEAVAEQIHKAGVDYFILNNDESNIGYFAITIAEDDLFISKLYVLKQFRRQGYAKQAYQFLKGLSEAMGLKTITLHVNKQNADSIAVYEKFGMKNVDAIVTDIGDGFAMDDYVMQANL